MTVNDRMKELRLSLNLSQEQFGQPLGLTKTSISSIENGVRSVSSRTLRFLILEYHASEQWLRSGEGEMFDAHTDEISKFAAEIGLNEFQENLVRIVSELPADYQQMILRLARQIAAEPQEEPEETEYDRVGRIASAALKEYDRQKPETDDKDA